MAEKILNTRILMKIDTLEAWNSSTLKLKKGELAFATVAASAGTGLEEPVVMVKIGTEEEKTFSELPWAFHAKAADVLAACKTEAGLRAFVNGVIADAGIASDDAMQELAGKVATAEGEIDTLQSEMDAVEKKAADNAAAIETIEGRFGADTVALEISAAINALDLANTYEAKGEAAKVQTALDTYKTANDAAVKKVSDDLAGEIARAKAAEEANAGAITAIKDGTTIDSFADVETALAGKEVAGAAAQALADAKTYADGLAGNYDAKGAAAQALTDAKAYADGLAKDYDAAGSAADALEEAKGYTDSEMERLVGDTKVSDQISTQIANLKLSETYDAKGAAAAAESAAKSHADGLNTAMNTRVEALEAIDHDHDNKAVLDDITAEKVAAWDAAEKNAKDHADGLDGAMDVRVKALEAKFGEGEGNVESQIEAAVAAEAALREAADKALQDQIGAASAEGVAATGLHARIEELEGLVGDDKVSEAITAAVKVEEERAKGVESGLETRLKAVEDTYATDDDVAGLQNQINTIMNNPDAEGAINSINEFTAYVAEHGTIADGMRTDINKNKDDIAAEAKRAGEAEAELEGAINGVATDLETLDGVVATKAAQTDLEALEDRVEAVENELNTAETGLKARMTAVEGAIEALDGLVGDETVAKQITDITNPLTERVVALEAVDHSHANAAELDKFVDGDKAKLDAAVQTVTAGTGLTATKTGTDVAIAFDDTVTFIFDCGTSAV